MNNITGDLLRILHLEDDADFAGVVKNLLANGNLSADIVLVDTLERFVSALKSYDYDLILADYELRACTGLQALDEVRRVNYDAPFILLSGTLGEEAAIEALRRGAADYVLKQWPNRIAPAVRRAVEEARERMPRKQSESALCRKESFFRMLTENSLDLVCLLSRDAVIQYSSLSSKYILGYEPASLVGRHAFSLVHPNDLTAARLVFEKALQSHEPNARHDIRFQRQDGNWCFLEVTGRNFFNAPEIDAVVLSAKVVTERKLAEISARTSEARHRSLFEHACVGIAYCTFLTLEDRLEDFAFLDVNSAFERFTGLKNVIGKKVSQLFPDILQTAPEFLARLGQVAMTGRTDSFEIWFSPLQAWLAVSAYCRENKEFVIILDNITQRKQAEALLRLQSTALESVANAIVITDREGKITWVNAAFSELTGYSRDEAIGENPRLLKSGHHDPSLYKNLWETINSGLIWQGEFVNRRKDGTLFTDETTITPVFNESGRITLFVAVKQDMTKRKELEADLRQSQKLEAVGMLAGGVAHDFNNALAVILGNTELALTKEAELSKEIVDYLKEVHSAGERAASLTRQLLIFSRKQLAQPRPLLLTDVVAGITKMIKRLIPENIRIESHCAPGLPFISADEGMMEQVILNLVVNARDAMLDGGNLSITVTKVRIGSQPGEAISAAQTGEFVVLTVEDNGSGISSENLPRIFDPFFTTKEPGKGTGIGLATVQRIVNEHRGWVEVSSRVGVGTTFKVFLPSIAKPPQSRAPSKSKPLLPGGSEAILTVEDDAPLRRANRCTLEHFGYKVFEAATGREAIEVWNAHRHEIDLLLTDIIMPEGPTGVELAQDFRRARPNLKVMFLTGYRADELPNHREFFTVSDNSLLYKPCSIYLLLSTIRNSLDRPVP